jgi:hypothetical protein
MTKNNNDTNRNEMTKINEAAEVSLSIYNTIDSYKMPEGNRVAYKSLGQVLRSLVELLDNERNKSTDTHTAT